nr:YbgA family protein [Nitrosopumilus piranensis]
MSILSEEDIKEYVLKRFDDVKKGKISNLVTFQAMNKYMLMVHDQNELKILGNIVASYKKVSLSEIMSEYEKHLRKALEKPPTTKSHANAIMHIFGYFSKKFNVSEKELFFKLLNQFREGKITVGKILSEINPITYRFNTTYLANQTYFLLYADNQLGNFFQMLSQK